MKKQITLLAFLGLMTITHAQNIVQSTNFDNPLWGATQNTGVAIAPFYHWNAIVFDDLPSSSYYIRWCDASTGALLDLDSGAGSNPDVAYSSNADALVVAYENGGNIFVDDYYLATVSPTDYNLNIANFVAGGINPNVDMNSASNGVLTWESFGLVWMCSFNIGTFTAGPVVPIALGSNPDVALLDNNTDLVLTYEQSGQIVIATYDYSVLQIGGALPTTPPMMIPPNGTTLELPRVQSNRNSGFGPSELFTVVAQDDMGGTFDVRAFFFSAPGFMVNNLVVNNGINMCTPSSPRPVVAYDRDEVHIAFAQDYSCSTVPPGDPSARDVLMAVYDHGGNLIPPPPPQNFLEVNNFDFDFTFSATSLNTEYDGDYMITGTNYCEGIAFSCTTPDLTLWKVRDFAGPVFRQGDTNVSGVKVVKGVSEDVILVEVENTEGILTPSDLKMEFTLYDQSGRVVALPQYSQEGMIFRIDASALEYGIYLLHYTLNGETKAERIPHFKN